MSMLPSLFNTSSSSAWVPENLPCKLAASVKKFLTLASNSSAKLRRTPPKIINKIPKAIICVQPRFGLECGNFIFFILNFSVQKFLLFYYLKIVDLVLFLALNFLGQVVYNQQVQL